MPRKDDDEVDWRSRFDDGADSKGRGLDGGGSEAKGASGRDSKDAEIRRMLRWLSFAKPKLILGFEHLSPAYVPAMSSKTRGLSVCFEKVFGWRPPRQVLKDLDAGGYEISVQLSLSLFHLGSGTFFGSTWMGTPIHLGGDGRDKLPDIIDFDYSEVVYLVSRITDPSCIAVVEIVASKEDVQKKMVVSQYGCGWTMLNIFSSGNLPDIAEGHENVEIMVRPMFRIFCGSSLFVLSRSLSNLTPSPPHHLPPQSLRTCFPAAREIFF